MCQSHKVIPPLHSPLRLGRMNAANSEYIPGCFHYSVICLPIICCSESSLIHSGIYTHTLLRMNRNITAVNSREGGGTEHLVVHLHPPWRRRAD